jgi:hypothetical protein
MKRAIYLLAVISIFLVIDPTYGYLSVTEVDFRIKAFPGENISHELKVALSPDEPAPINIVIDLLDWYQDPKGINIGVKINPDIELYSAKNFLNVSPRSFMLSPGKFQVVRIEGTMPAGEGARYAIVSVYTKPNSTEETSGIAISFAMNKLAILTIKGSKLIKTGEIRDLKMDEPIFSKQQNGSIVFRNTGNNHYKILTEVYLKDENGNFLANSSNKIDDYIIPNATRIIDFSMIPDHELKPGNYFIGSNVALEDGTILDNQEKDFKI